MKGRVCSTCRQDAPLRYWAREGERRRSFCRMGCKRVYLANRRVAEIRAATSTSEDRDATALARA